MVHMDSEQIKNFIIQFVTSWGSKLIGALIIFLVGITITKKMTKWIKTSHKLDRMDDSLRSFLVSFSKIILYILLIITIAMILGVPATSFITILASCGVAIGLALQGSLSNFAGGLMILFFKPFKVGDFIEASGESGTVTEISVVYTVLLTPDNKRITLPNGNLTNSVIKNYSSEEIRRVDMTFNVAYDSDVQKVKNILTDIATSHPYALTDPEPTIRMSAHGDSALAFVVRVWCKNENYWDVFFEITEKAKLAFDENGIEIPFPQMDVHVKNK